MSKYIDVLLVEDLDGTPHVVTAPGCTAEKVDAVAFNGTMGTVIHKAYMNPEKEEYAILAAMVPIYEADAVYILRYEKENGDAS